MLKQPAQKCSTTSEEVTNFLDLTSIFLVLRRFLDLPRLGSIYLAGFLTGLHLPSMCLLLPFFHRCWQWNPDLEIIFPAEKRTRSIQFFTQQFFRYIQRTRSIAHTNVAWVAYCRTRGPTGYPFLLIRLQYRNLWHHSILMKLEGDDSHEKTPVLTIGRVDTTVRGVVGTWRYDVYQTVVFPRSPSPPGLGDFLALADLANARDCTRAAFPVTVYYALKTLFNGTVLEIRIF
ncbi:hypothetical protein K438DRAFT_1799405, partial [Mycena galopus ATCC 62051]